MNEQEGTPFIWEPIKLTDRATGRSVHISILEREMYLSSFFTFEDFWEMKRPADEQAEPGGEVESMNDININEGRDN